MISCLKLGMNKTHNKSLHWIFIPSHTQTKNTPNRLKFGTERFHEK